MSIYFDDRKKLLTLQTESTTYQMGIDAYGFLRHLYYGRAVLDSDMSFLHRQYDRGFSGNPYECGSDRTFSLDTAGLEYSSVDVGDYRIHSLSVVNGDGSFGANLRFAGYEIRKGKYALPGLPAVYANVETEADTLVVTLRDPGTLVTVNLYYGVFPEKDIITRAVEIQNSGGEPLILEKAASACVDIPFGAWDLIHFHGRHCMERQMERVPLRHCIQTVASNRGISSHHHNPFVILCGEEATEDAGDCYGFMLVWSGNHKTEAELDQFGSTRIVMGISDEKFRWTLSPGESFFTPEVILSFTSEGLGALSWNYHAIIRHNLCRGRYKTARRPVLYNNWEATMADFTEEKILSLAAQAADLGIELFVLDDGWFHLRKDDNAGLGDWFADRSKLPGGLAALAQNIRALGMQFGLWIEPESVNEDSDLYRQHPDWALAVPNRRPTRARNQLVLDLSRQDVQEYLYNCISTLLTDADISYIKWDMNRALCDVYSRQLPPERQGEVGHRYVLGLYSLLDRLTNAFPHVLFEGCAGGGGRFDAGMLHYTPQIWCSDDTDPILRLEIQRGTSYGYPVSAIGSHVTASPNQQSGRTTSLSARGIVAMSGSFGYEMDLNVLSEAQRAEIREQIRTFRQYYALIHEGRLYRLTDHRKNGFYDAWQFVSQDRRESLVHVAAVNSQANGPLAHLRLKGLEETAQYRVNDAEGHILSGAALMYGGYTLPQLFGDYPAVQLYLVQTDAPA